MTESTTPATGTFAFDPDDPGYTRNPYPTYNWLRSQPPYLWAKHDAWIFSRYDDVVTIMRDYRRFTPNWADWEHAARFTSDGQVHDYDRLMASGLFALPHDGHVRLRKLVSPAFTPRAIERMRDKVQAIVDDALDHIEVQDGRFDVAGLAEHIPLRAISAVLGIPRTREPEFRRFGVSVIDASDRRLTPAARLAVLEPFTPGLELLRAVIDERVRQPADDLLSMLIAAEEAGDRLNHDELLSLVMALIAAGSETTVHLICFAVYTLLRHPAELARLRADPSLVRGAIEEVLRFDSFGKNGVPRFARDDVEIGGVRVRKGQMIYPLLPAALRDPDAFPRADVFDIGRDQTANVTFGTGPHHCVGAALARLEGEIAITTLFARFPSLRLVGDPVFAPHSFLRKMESLPVAV